MVTDAICDNILSDTVKIRKEYVIDNGVCDICQEETVCVSTESNKNKKICQNCIYTCVLDVNKPKPPLLNQCKVCLETKSGRTWEKDGITMSVCDDCVFTCVLQTTAQNNWIETNGDPIMNLKKEIKELKEQLKDIIASKQQL